jgi:hypothetical protein
LYRREGLGSAGSFKMLKNEVSAAPISAKMLFRLLPPNSTIPSSGRLQSRPFRLSA